MNLNLADQTFPFYWRTPGTNRVVLFKDHEKCLVVTNSKINGSSIEEAKTVDFLTMMFTDHETCTKLDFAVALINATKNIEQYYSPEMLDVELLVEKHEDKIVKVFNRA